MHAVHVQPLDHDAVTAASRWPVPAPNTRTQHCKNVLRPRARSLTFVGAVCLSKHWQCNDSFFMQDLEVPSHATGCSWSCARKHLSLATAAQQYPEHNWTWLPRSMAISKWVLQQHFM
jgi:hypothetical protein